VTEVKVESIRHAKRKEALVSRQIDDRVEPS